MTFAEALREFLKHDEVADVVKLHVWDKPFPYKADLNQFAGKKLRRADVFAAANESDEKGAIFALVWGYPDGHTDYRTRNRETSLQAAMGDIENVGRKIHSIKEEYEVVSKLNEHPGLGTASTSKIAYFAGLKHYGNECLIFDMQVVRSILTQAYRELDMLREGLKLDLIGSSYSGNFSKHVRDQVDDEAKYLAYIKCMPELRRSLGGEFESDDIERFLFELGREHGRTAKTKKFTTLSKSSFVMPPTTKKPKLPKKV